MIQTQEGNRIFLVLIKLVVYFFDLMLCISFIEIFPSIIVVKNLKQSINENFTIFRENFKRLLFSIGIYHLTFRGPMFIVDVTRILSVTNVETFLFFNMIFMIVTVINALIGIPILSLISTRIYNTTILSSEAIPHESHD